MKHLTIAALTLLVCTPLFAEAPKTAPAKVDFSTSCSRLAEIRRASQPLLWYRTAAEQRAIYIEIFRAASARLSEMASRNPGKNWVVVSDADETLLDNSPFKCENEWYKETELAKGNDKVPDFIPALWDEWVVAASALATPGAAEFVRDVHALGGKLVVVSNREDLKHKADTDKNFRALGIIVDQYALKAGASDKNPRFDQIARAVVPGGTEPPEIWLFLGDNIQDFPGTTQSQGDIGGEFGKRFFVFPNPTYGSWQSNAFR